MNPSPLASSFLRRPSAYSTTRGSYFSSKDEISLAGGVSVAACGFAGSSATGSLLVSFFSSSCAGGAASSGAIAVKCHVVIFPCLVGSPLGDNFMASRSSFLAGACFVVGFFAAGSFDGDSLLGTLLAAS